MTTSTVLALLLLSVVSDAVAVPGHYRSLDRRPDPDQAQPPADATAIWDTAHGRRTLLLQLLLGVLYSAALAAGVFALVAYFGTTPPIARSGQVSPEFLAFSDRLATLSPAVILVTACVVIFGAAWIARRLRERASWFTHPNAPAGAPRWWRLARAVLPVAIRTALLIALAALGTPAAHAAIVVLTLLSTAGLATTSLLEGTASRRVLFTRILLALAATALVLAAVDPVWRSPVGGVLALTFTAAIMNSSISSRFNLPVMAEHAASHFRRRPSEGLR